MTVTTHEAGLPGFTASGPGVRFVAGVSLGDARADLVAGHRRRRRVPQAMAYAMVAGLPAQYGLYTAIVMTAVGALFASSTAADQRSDQRDFDRGAERPWAIVPSGAKTQAAVLLAFMVGVMQLGITLFRLGDLTRYISHSVIVGFTLGASALLVLDQIKNLLGLARWAAAHDTSCIASGSRCARVGTSTLHAVDRPRLDRARARAALAEVPLGLRLLPELLLGPDHGGRGRLARARANGVRVVGEIPAELPRLGSRARLRAIRDLSSGALAIAVLGLLEAIAMSKALPPRHGRGST